MHTKPLLSFSTLLLTGMLVVAPFSAASAATDTSTIESTNGFRKAVTLAGIREHQAAFQGFAEANPNGNGVPTRASGTKGFDVSAQYVYDRAKAAGYNVQFQEFPFTYVETVKQEGRDLSPTARNLAPIIMTYSPSTPVSGITADVAVVPTDSTPGCEAIDFATQSYAGKVALVSRGSCPFAQKATNAAGAGAVAVLIYNNAAGTLNGTLGDPSAARIPTAGVTADTGAAMIADAANGTVSVFLNFQVIREQRTTRNVIAETTAGDPNRVVVVGAHLDSVVAGPGINDNGSGSATILEVAEVFGAQQRETRNKLRFIWFGAEELGLLGSNHYVNNLTQAEIDQIELNLNFDMVGSPNYVRFVYDGNNSAFPVGPGAAAGPAGSGAIEEAFHEYFASQGLPSAETPFSGRSDYGPFIAKGIPAGGLFTGAEGVKTAEQAQIYGGTVGVAYDRCYHQACDTFTNNSDTGLDQMSDAVAHAVLVFSKANFPKQPLVNGVLTKGKGNGGEGGGLHNEHDHEMPIK